MMKKLLGGALAFALVSPAQAQVATATRAHEAAARAQERAAEKEVAAVGLVERLTGELDDLSG